MADLIDLLVGLLTALIVCFLIKLFTNFWINFQFSKNLDAISGTKPRHWLWGHRKIFKYDKEHLDNVVENSKIFPSSFNFWYLPSKSMVFCYHPNTIGPFISTAAPKLEIIYKSLRPWIGDGLLVSKGKKWNRTRRLITPAFHFNMLKSYTEKFNSCAFVFLSQLEHQVNKPTNIYPLSTLLTLDVILRCAMSSNTRCQLIGEKQEPYIKAVFTATDCMTMRMRNPIYMFDLIFNLSPLGRRFKRAVAVLHKHTEEIIHKRQQDLNRNKDTQQNTFDNQYERQMDFLDILLSSKDDNGTGLTVQEVRDEVDTFLFEGHDTTASGLSWALFNLAKYPEYQKKCRKEVEEIVGKKAFITWSDVKDMNYLSMFLKESLRLYPPVFFIGRVLEEPVSADRFQDADDKKLFPAKTQLSAHIYALHRNSHIWKDPEVFDPERFTFENISKRSSFSFLPFSSGPRNCIGQNFAVSELKVILAQTLRKFHLYIDDECEEPEIFPRVTLKSLNGIFIKFSHV